MTFAGMDSVLRSANVVDLGVMAQLPPANTMKGRNQVTVGGKI
jgi:hypothetical protein